MLPMSLLQIELLANHCKSVVCRSLLRIACFKSVTVTSTPLVQLCSLSCKQKGNRAARAMFSGIKALFFIFISHGPIFTSYCSRPKFFRASSANQVSIAFERYFFVVGTNGAFIRIFRKVRRLFSRCKHIITRGKKVPRQYKKFLWRFPTFPFPGSFLSRGFFPSGKMDLPQLQLEMATDLSEKTVTEIYSIQEDISAVLLFKLGAGRTVKRNVGHFATSYA